MLTALLGEVVMKRVRKEQVQRLPVGDPVDEPVREARVHHDARAFWAQPGVKEAAREIRKAEGVRGIAWGLRNKGGAWTDEACLVVYVERKWPKDRMKKGEDLRKRFKETPLDVIEVGSPRVHVLSAEDRVFPTMWSERSAITAVLQTSGGGRIRTWFLTSGHGVVPGGEPFRDVTTASGEVVLSDDASYRYPARLHRAEFNGKSDYGLLEYEGQEVAVDPKHPLLPGRAPWSLRDTDVHLGVEVEHHSPERGRRIRGRVMAISGEDAVTGITIRSNPGTPVFYPEVLCVVSNNAEPFSKGGDSGSLVVDAHQHVVGTVVGGQSRTGASGWVDDITFVLPLARGTQGARSKLIDLGRFFQ